MPPSRFPASSIASASSRRSPSRRVLPRPPPEGSRRSVRDHRGAPRDGRRRDGRPRRASGSRVQVEQRLVVGVRPVHEIGHHPHPGILDQIEVRGHRQPLGRLGHARCGPRRGFDSGRSAGSRRARVPRDGSARASPRRRASWNRRRGQRGGRSRSMAALRHGQPVGRHDELEALCVESRHRGGRRFDVSIGSTTIGSALPKRHANAEYGDAADRRLLSMRSSAMSRRIGGGATIGSSMIADSSGVEPHRFLDRRRRSASPRTSTAHVAGVSNRSRTATTSAWIQDAQGLTGAHDVGERDRRRPASTSAIDDDLGIDQRNLNSRFDRSATSSVDPARIRICRMETAETSSRARAPARLRALVSVPAHAAGLAAYGRV